MSGNKFLLDTNAVLYILNGDVTLADFLFEKELYLSIISEMELLSYRNISVQERQKIEEFLGEFIIVNIDENVKLNTIEVKKTSGMKLPDSIIAATAISLKLPLISSDKYFKNVKHLNLIYYEK
ncbi:type II toxin-antitoxin system VapC family toxin [Mucilaginibacter sp.]|uniref:type II toxin-antitoxin system VapC family toxin n=1 Tax=Mucilaginibacter sp. TaxID=1882438 RepID=UPI0028437B9E|nr:type II toxin-antitoxin system VapC family toxin [Mucilaginibacter sp.]MDR3693088.1 type II toxin-antitoxin system VapC family toxin [Mucilaginibacter sp.]